MELEKAKTKRWRPFGKVLHQTSCLNINSNHLLFDKIEKRHEISKELSPAMNKDVFFQSADCEANLKVTCKSCIRTILEQLDYMKV